MRGQLLRAAGRLWLSAGALLVLLATQAHANIQAFHRTYGPKSVMRVSTPTLQWEVWPGEGNKVTSSEMLLNGDRVEAKYDGKARRLLYRPEKPLLAGVYRVQCKVVVENELVVTKDWNFQVSTEAQPTLPAPIATQDEALAASNRLRALLGLDDFVQEHRLNAAALGHSNYLTTNRRSGHYEKPDEPGFVGATPWERLEAFGWVGSSWECVTTNSGNVQQSVDALFDAPYHRIPFMQPGQVFFGSGYAGKSLTIKFSDGDKHGTVVSPADGQTNVALDWDGNENPNPLRIHGVRGRTGYPIVVTHFSPENERLTGVEAKLTLDGEDVAFMLNTPENDDHLTNAVLLIPRKPLQSGKRYEVSVGFKLAKGGEVYKTWSFVTR